MYRVELINVLRASGKAVCTQQVDKLNPVRSSKFCGGGLDEGVPPVRVAGDGSITDGTYSETQRLNGGFCVLKLATREEAEAWAAKLAAACRCPQELRQFVPTSSVPG